MNTFKVDIVESVFLAIYCMIIMDNRLNFKVGYLTIIIIITGEEAQNSTRID